MKYLLPIIVLLISSNIYSQIGFSKATVYNNENEKQIGYVKIVNNKELNLSSQILFKENKDSQKDLFEVSDSLFRIEFDKKTYVLKPYINDSNKKVYKYFELINEGAISILKFNNRFYLDSKELGLKDVSHDYRDLRHGTYFKKGMITVYVNKCSEAHNLAYSLYNISLYKLNEIIDIYNSCEVLNENSKTVSDLAIEESYRTDLSHLHVGVGVGYFTNDYTNLYPIQEHNIKNNSLAYSLYTSFNYSLHSMKEYVFFTTKLNYTWQNESEITAANLRIKEKLSFMNVDAGVNVFLTKNNTFESYLGVNGKILFHNTVIEVYTPERNLNNVSGLVDFTYSFNIGANVKIHNSSFAIGLEYYPGFKYEVEQYGELATILDNKDINHAKTSFLGLNIGYILF